MARTVLFGKRFQIGTLALIAGVSLGAGNVVLAQENAAQPAASAATWTDPEFGKIAGMISGTWKSAAPVKVGSDSFEVVTSFAPVAISDVPNAFYGEVARGDALDRPYRQIVLQLHRVKGKIRMKTMEFRRPKGEQLSLVGLWAAPQSFPKSVSMADLVTTLDIELTAEGDGYKGATPHPYPTSAGGASEMTSEIAFGPGRFQSADRGFGADGQVVWGPAAGESYAFQKIENPIKVDASPDGLVMLTYPSKLEGKTFAEGDQITLHYVGCLENGWVVDSSYQRNSPFVYNYGRRLIEGWTRGVADSQKGLKRRLVIPGPLAYKEAGRERDRIGPNATLYYMIDVLNIEPVTPTEPAPAAATTSDTQPVKQ